VTRDLRGRDRSQTMEVQMSTPPQWSGLTPPLTGESASRSKLTPIPPIRCVLVQFWYSGTHDWDHWTIDRNGTAPEDALSRTPWVSLQGTSCFRQVTFQGNHGSFDGGKIPCSRLCEGMGFSIDCLKNAQRPLAVAQRTLQVPLRLENLPDAQLTPRV
jgi:hypothetical protein